MPSALRVKSNYADNILIKQLNERQNVASWQSFPVINQARARKLVLRCVINARLYLLGWAF